MACSRAQLSHLKLRCSITVYYVDNVYDSNMGYYGSADQSEGLQIFKEKLVAKNSEWKEQLRCQS